MVILEYIKPAFVKNPNGAAAFTYGVLYSSFVVLVLLRQRAVCRGSPYCGAKSARTPVNCLTLSLLMLRVRANDHYLAMTANDLAFLAHRLY